MSEPRSRGLRRRSQPAEDRQDLSAWQLVAIVLLTAGSVGLAASSVPSRGGTGLPLMAGASAAALAVFGLPSVPLRWAVRAVVLLGAALALTLGGMQDVTGRFTSRSLTAWVAVSVAALVVSSSRAGGLRLARLVVAAAGLVAAVSLLLGPTAAEGFLPGPTAAERFNRDDLSVDNPLVANAVLDMRHRPRLTDRQVMTVRAERRAFWRTATYDVWDGVRWRRSIDTLTPVVGGMLKAGRHEMPEGRSVELVQRFELSVGFASLVPAAATPSRVDAVETLDQFPDATLLATDVALGEGSGYEVVSVLPLVTEAELREAGRRSVPAVVAQRYGSRPTTTPRVRAAAAQIRDRAAASTPTGQPPSSFDFIEAAEAWMGERTRYSLNAPLAPDDADVVDDFLFESKLGWCEQIASSLVVLAREAGIPARLATGYVPGEWDPLAGRFVVRERDAHAWAEVWFPGVGWVSFDPTADVPLSGESDSLSASGSGTGTAVTALAVASLLAIAGPAARKAAVRVVGRIRAGLSGRRDRSRRSNGTWDQKAELELEDLGAGLGRERLPGETLPAYAETVATLSGEASLTELAERIERERYSPSRSTGSSAGSSG